MTKQAGYVVQCMTSRDDEQGDTMKETKEPSDSPPQTSWHHTPHSGVRRTPYIMHQDLVKACNELVEGLRIVRLERGKGIVNLGVLVWRGEPPDKL